MTSSPSVFMRDSSCWLLLLQSSLREQIIPLPLPKSTPDSYRRAATQSHDGEHPFTFHETCNIDKSQDKQIGSGRVDVFVLRKAAPLICDERDDEEEQRYYSTNLPSQGWSTPPSSPLLLPIPLHLSAVTFNFSAVQLSSHLPLKVDELPTHSNANLRALSPPRSTLYF
ncbi:uncharacterized [Tachysurus ichikawai]